MPPGSKQSDRDDPYLDMVVTGFEGGITTRILASPERAFAFEVSMELAHPRLLALAGQKPPKHFHPFQDEYIQVVEGSLMVEIGNVERLLRPEDGEVCIPAWAHHRLYPPPPLLPAETDQESPAVSRFLLSAEKTDNMRRLDSLFFENWYAYQDEIVVRGKRVDVLQVMCMFDAGGSYLSFPWFIPFGRTLSVVLGIVLGRWLGGLLGYQAFYREWTTDWELACEKMENTAFQKGFADHPKTS